MPLEQAVLDFQSEGLVGTADGPRTRVVLVAARRDMVERLLAATTVAGLRVEGIDLSAFALIRALHRPADGAALCAYVNVGSLTEVALATEAQCRFRRVIPYGHDQMVADLAARRALTTEHARGWIDHVGLAEPVDAIEGQAEIIAHTRDSLEESVARVATEIGATIDFHAGQDGGVPTERVILSGVASAIPGFGERLAGELGLPVEVRTVPEARPGVLSECEPSRLTIAAGLTTTRVPA